MQSQRLVSYTVRLDKKLMLDAGLAAAANDEKVAQVIRKAIRVYVEDWRRKEAIKNGRG